MELLLAYHVFQKILATFSDFFDTLDVILAAGLYLWVPLQAAIEHLQRLSKVLFSYISYVGHFV